MDKVLKGKKSLQDNITSWPELINFWKTHDATEKDKDQAAAAAATEGGAMSTYASIKAPILAASSTGAALSPRYPFPSPSLGMNRNSIVRNSSNHRHSAHFEFGTYTARSLQNYEKYNELQAYQSNREREIAGASSVVGSINGSPPSASGLMIDGERESEMNSLAKSDNHIAIVQRDGIKRFGSSDDAVSSGLNLAILNLQGLNRDSNGMMMMNNNHKGYQSLYSQDTVNGIKNFIPESDEGTKLNISSSAAQDFDNTTSNNDNYQANAKGETHPLLYRSGNFNTNSTDAKSVNINKKSLAGNTAGNNSESDDEEGSCYFSVTDSASFNLIHKDLEGKREKTDKSKDKKEKNLHADDETMVDIKKKTVPRTKSEKIRRRSSIEKIGRFEADRIDTLLRISPRKIEHEDEDVSTRDNHFTSRNSNLNSVEEVGGDKEKIQKALREAEQQFLQTGLGKEWRKSSAGSSEEESDDELTGDKEDKRKKDSRKGKKKKKKRRKRRRVTRYQEGDARMRAK